MANTAKVITKDVVCVPPGTSVRETAALMKKKNIGSVLVGRLPKPEGIFTERDVVRRVVAEGLNPKTTQVQAVMTRRMVTVDRDEPVRQVFECLAKGQFRHLPITERGNVVGIVSLTDMVRILREMYKDEKFLQAFADEAS